ncbi:MAG: anaerobic sulfite reductase subunit AsrB [Clostridiales bacterium]|nr:anaerobic sulfite reductase subunit AsrB [Clostridiales bacterium]
MKNVMIPKPHEITHVIKHTKAEYTFRVACDDETKHGQFYMLSIPKIGEAPISVSGKGDGYLEFTIRKVGRLTEGVFGLDVGDTIFMRGPYGNSFPVEDFENKHLVVITGGTGMAPVKTMLDYFSENQDKIKSLHLISGFRDLDCVLFTDEIDKYKCDFNVICSLDNMEAPGFHKGLVTEHIKKIHFDTFDEYSVVVVGPPLMMHFTTKELLANGVDESRIWVSIERKMHCAVGKCGHCKINDTYVCLEGPIFNYTDAKDLID